MPSAAARGEKGHRPYAEFKATLERNRQSLGRFATSLLHSTFWMNNISRLKPDDHNLAPWKEHDNPDLAIAFRNLLVSSSTKASGFYSEPDAHRHRHKIDAYYLPQVDERIDERPLARGYDSVTIAMGKTIIKPVDKMIIVVEGINEQGEGFEEVTVLVKKDAPKFPLVPGGHWDLESRKTFKTGDFKLDGQGVHITTRQVFLPHPKNGGPNS